MAKGEKKPKQRSSKGARQPSKKKGPRQPAKRAKPTKLPPKTAKTAKHARTVHAERFDRNAYEVPVMDLAEAIALATSLLAVTPKQAAKAIAEEAALVATARDRARVVLKAQGPGSATSVDARAYDVAMDRAWATFVRRIQDHIELPGPRRPDAADLPKVYAVVRDLSILKLNYLAEFAQIGARLDALKREGLLEAAGALAGPAFLEEVLRCHGEYGEALGVSAPAAAPGDGKAQDRGEARLALIEAISEYAVQVMAQARAGRHESWAAAHAALKPIADLRAHHQRAHHAPDAPRPRPVHPPIERPVSIEGPPG